MATRTLFSVTRTVDVSVDSNLLDNLPQLAGHLTEMLKAAYAGPIQSPAVDPNAKSSEAYDVEVSDPGDDPTRPFLTELGTYLFRHAQGERGLAQYLDDSGTVTRTDDLNKYASLLHWLREAPITHDMRVVLPEQTFYAMFHFPARSVIYMLVALLRAESA